MKIKYRNNTKIFFAIAMQFIVSFLSYAEIPQRFYGTYVSRVYINEFKKTHCHLIAALKAINEDLYPVINIRPDGVFSSYMLHDGYILDLKEFSGNWHNESKEIIHDIKGKEYVRISESDDGYKAIRYYYLSIICKFTETTDTKGNVLSYAPSQGLRLNGIKLELLVDVMLRDDNDMDVIFNWENRIWHGIKDDGMNIYIYTIESNETAVGFDINPSKTKLLYSFPNK